MKSRNVVTVRILFSFFIHCKYLELLYIQYSVFLIFWKYLQWEKMMVQNIWFFPPLVPLKREKKCIRFTQLILLSLYNIEW